VWAAGVNLKLLTEMPDLLLQLRNRYIVGPFNAFHCVLNDINYLIK